MQVPQRDAGGVLLLVVAGQHQVSAAVCQSCRVEVQQGVSVLQSVKMLLGRDTEHIKVVCKIGAYQHLQQGREKLE